MKVIDCDAHVEECVETWQYLDPEFYLLRPIPVTFPEDTCFGTHNAAWVIDYKLRFFAANPTTMKRRQKKMCPSRCRKCAISSNGCLTWMSLASTSRWSSRRSGSAASPRMSSSKPRSHAVQEQHVDQWLAERVFVSCAIAAGIYARGIEWHFTTLTKT